MDSSDPIVISQSIQLLRTYTHLLTDHNFQAIETSGQRIEYFLQKVRPFHLFRAEVDRNVANYSAQHIKSQIRSKNCRIVGMKSFREKNYKTSLEWYTKAILSAPFPSKTGSYGNALGLSFAGKSVVDFQLKNYESALNAANASLEFFETVEMFLQRIHCLRLLGRHQESLERLNQLIDRTKTEPKLKIRCRADLRALKKSIITATVLSKKPETYPKPDDMESFDGQLWIHPTFELKSDPEKGRHFAAKQFVPKGTILMMEQPFNSFVFLQKTHCNHCRKPLDRQLWPCSKCDEMAFCSKKCSLDAYENYHKHECTFSGFIRRFSSLYVQTFHIISRYGVRRAIKWEPSKSDIDFERYVSDVQTSETMDFQTMYRAFSSLADNSSHCDKYQRVCSTFKAIYVAFLLMSAAKCDLDFKSFVVLADICFRSSQKVSTNVFGEYLFQPERKHIANSVTIVGSFFNHSCDPNVIWTFRRGKFVAEAYKDIQTRDELNISYGPSIRNQSLCERQLKLRTSYHFTCRCERCLGESRSLLTLQCDHCSGPVIYNLSLPKHLVDRKIYCLQCGKNYKNLDKSRVKVEVFRTMFERMIADLDNEYNISVSLKMAKVALQEMLQLVQYRSRPILKSTIDLISQYHNYDKVEEAIELGKLIEKSIESEKCISLPNESVVPIIVFEYLFVMTDCYHKYLESGLVSDTIHWEKCFRFYSELIEYLEKQNKCVDNEETEEEESSERMQLFADVIALKRNELSSLKTRHRIKT